MLMWPGFSLVLSGFYDKKESRYEERKVPVVRPAEDGGMVIVGYKTIKVMKAAPDGFWRKLHRRIFKY